jgi:hypothetical protein
MLAPGKKTRCRKCKQELWVIEVRLGNVGGVGGEEQNGEREVMVPNTFVGKRKNKRAGTVTKKREGTFILMKSYVFTKFYGCWVSLY